MKIFASIWRWIFSILMPVAIIGLVLVVCSITGTITISSQVDLTGKVVNAAGLFDIVFSSPLINCKGFGLAGNAEVTIGVSGGAPVIEKSVFDTVVQIGNFEINVMMAIGVGCIVFGSLLSLIGHHSRTATIVGTIALIAGLACYVKMDCLKSGISFQFTKITEGKDPEQLGFVVPFVNTIVLGVAAIVLSIFNTVVAFIEKRNYVK